MLPRREVRTWRLWTQVTHVPEGVIHVETGNLDPETSQQVIGYLEEFNREGRTIVMVTHDPRAAKRAKRTLWLQGGAITCQGAGEEDCWEPDGAMA